MSPQETQLLKAALAYWRKKTKDMSPEGMTWLDATRERRLNLLTAIDEAMVVAEFWQETAVLMIQLFHFMERRGYWTSWIPTLEKAIKLCSNPDLHEGARLKSQLSQLYRKSNQFDDANQLYEQVLTYATVRQNSDLIVTVYRDMAESYIVQNQLDKAEAVVLQALKWTKNKNARMYVFVLETLGKVYRIKGNNEDALRYYQKAVTIRKVLNEPYTFAIVLNEMSLVLVDMGEYESSLVTLQEAMTILEKTDYQSLKQLIMGNQGFAYYRQNKFTEAEKAFLMIDLFDLKRSGELHSYGHTLQNIGDVKLRQGKYEDAEPYIAEAIKTFRAINDDVQLANSLGTLAELLASKNKLHQATLYFDEAIQLLEEYPNNDWGQRLLEDFVQQRQGCESP